MRVEVSGGIEDKRYLSSRDKISIITDNNDKFKSILNVAVARRITGATKENISDSDVSDLMNTYLYTKDKEKREAILTYLIVLADPTKSDVDIEDDIEEAMRIINKYL